MNKKQKLKAILEQLIMKTRKTGSFSKNEIERAIQVSLMAADERTIANWFDLLWKLEFFEQPTPNLYNLNWERIVDLEVARPVDLDVSQRRLT